MTRTPSALLAAIAAALALPAPARASFDWMLRAGVEQQWTTSEAPQAPSSTVPRLEVDLALDLAGSAPGVLSWAGGAQYRRTAVTREDVDDVRDQLSYRLRSTLFSNPKSPITLSAHATRVEDDFSLDGDAVGSVLATAYGGDLALNAGTLRPSLRGGYTYSETERDSPLLGETSRTVHSVTGEAGHGTTQYTWNARYRGNFGEGTYAFDNFDDHRLDVMADVAVARTVRLQVSDLLFIRRPSTTSPFNPRQELNSFSAIVNHRPGDGDAQSASYFYAHGLQSTPTFEDVERVRHRLAYSILRVLPDPEWRIRAEADASLTEDQVGATEMRAAGQSLGATAYWRRERDANLLELRAGPVVGVLEPEGEDPVLGYGGRAGVTAGRSARIATHATYELSYESDLRGVPGWSIRQHANGWAEGRLGPGSLRGMLQASGERRQSPTVGSGATRSLTATLGYRTRRSDVALTAGVQDGFAGAAPGDGLFLTAPFDTHTRHAALDASTSLWRYLTVRGRLRTSSRDLPDRPALDQQEAFATVELNYGALRIGLEERYVRAEVPTGTARVNQVFLRVSRVLGSRY